MADIFPSRFGGGLRIGPGGGRPPSRGGGLPRVAPKPPQINMGAVAQARQQGPGMFTGLQHLFAPIEHAGPTLRKELPTPKQILLNKNEQRAKSIIADNNPQEFHKATPQIKKLITNPSPSLHIHLAADPFLQGQHQALMGQVGPEAQAISKAWGLDKLGKQTVNLRAGKWGPGTGVTASQAQDYQAKQQMQAEKPSTMGFGAIPALGPVGGFLQRFGTEAAQTGKGLGPGIYDVAKHAALGGVELGQKIATATGQHPGGSQVTGQGQYFENLGKAQLGSWKKDFTTTRFWDEPFNFAMDVLPFASGGASAALKAGDISALADAARAGDISATQAALQGAKVLNPLRPHGIERRLGAVAPDKHFDATGLDNLGRDKGDYVTGYHPRMPIWANEKNPGKSIFGPPGLGHADIGEGRGMTQASAWIDPDTGRVGGVNLHGKGGGRTPETELALTKRLKDLANEKLGEARSDPYAVQLPAAKSAIGALLQTKVLDPATVRAVERGAAPTFRAMGKQFKMPSATGILQGRYGKLIRRDLEMRQQMYRGQSEVELARQYGLPGPYGPSKEIPNADLRDQLHPGEIQKLAYGKGAAKVHAEEWHNLYNGLPGPNQHIMDNIDNYVAIKKPPPREEILKNSGAYSSEPGIARQWDRTVVKNTENETAASKIRANPDDYAYMPKRVWEQLRFKDPNLGMVQKPIQGIDNITQIVRSGRFMHPGYIAWALQNGILHLSQAGMYAFRNARQIHTDWARLSDTDKALFDNSVGAGHYGGGITRATSGSEATLLGGKRLETVRPIKWYKGKTQQAARFWHTVDDAPFRRMSLIHELNRQGYHTTEDWSNLMHTDPGKFRAIARQSQREAIDYSEMSPAERASMQKLFTAWGWTRGATSYTGRFPFQHPIQAGVASQVGQQGEKTVQDYWSKQGGVAPSWLAGYLPMGGGKLLESGLINPAETAASLLEEIPGATKGQTESLASMEAPGPAAILEGYTGLTKYGQHLRGNQRLTQPLADLASRFEPYAALKSALSAKKGGGTFKEGLVPGLERYAGIPMSTLTDPKKTAALGMKDYEQALSMPDEIRFRHDYSVQQLPQQLQEYQRQNGYPLDSGSLAKLRHDFDAVETRDLFQSKYASDHGANSFKSLPGLSKAQAGIQFMLANKYVSQATANSWKAQLAQVQNDTEANYAANTIWASHQIGQAANAWKKIVKQMQPQTLTPAR
jgi:hypothetical protein